jgi:hypothetical protein
MVQSELPSQSIRLSRVAVHPHRLGRDETKNYYRPRGMTYTNSPPSSLTVGNKSGQNTLK